MMNSLFNMHHKIKLKLDAICQEAGDMNVEEFMLVYNDICLERRQQQYKELAEKEEEREQYAIANPIQAEKARSWDELNNSNFFKEDIINDMDMGQ